MVRLEPFGQFLQQVVNIGKAGVVAPALLGFRVLNIAQDNTVRKSAPPLAVPLLHSTRRADWGNTQMLRPFLVA